MYHRRWAGRSKALVVEERKVAVREYLLAAVVGSLSEEYGALHTALTRFLERSAAPLGNELEEAQLLGSSQPWSPPFPLPLPHSYLPGSSGGGTQRSFHRALSPTAGPVGPEPLTSPIFRCAGRENILFWLQLMGLIFGAILGWKRFL